MHGRNLRACAPQQATSGRSGIRCGRSAVSRGRRALRRPSRWRSKPSGSCSIHCAGSWSLCRWSSGAPPS